MFTLPTIDYSPLSEEPISTKEVEKKFGIDLNSLASIMFKNDPLSLTDNEVRRAAYLDKFVTHNNFHLIGNIPDLLPFPRTNFYSIATLSNPGMITYGFIMRLDAGWLELGELRFKISSSSDDRDQRFTYAKVTLDQVFPDLTLDSQNAGLPTNAIGKSVYKTESGEFNRNFKLYLDRTHAQAGLKVLSPDVMAVLIDQFYNFDIEMRDHTISFITHGYDLLDPGTLKELLEAISLLTTTVARQVRSPAAHSAIPGDIKAYKVLYSYSKKSSTSPYVVYPLIIFGVLAVLTIIVGLASVMN